jgi:hypothetical protein
MANALGSSCGGSGSGAPHAVSRAPLRGAAHGDGRRPRSEVHPAQIAMEIEGPDLGEGQEPVERWGRDGRWAGHDGAVRQFLGGVEQ